VDPTDLIIEKGLTGIVGPNGCGKSNLVEALRWAMGESSAKKMRGAEMDEVIFSGTENRPPRNIAEVTIFLEKIPEKIISAFSNQEKTEISRRIERGKGSLFRVNGKDVRAKDVQLIFADLSSGPRSAAMVSQGMIGSLINDKPTERRTILEEAANITGLHGRRHEAELKLKSALTNLERLSDVIEALQGQFAGLKKQARQAGRYRTISGSIRAAEALVLLIRLSGAQEELISINTSLSNAKKIVEEKVAKVAKASETHTSAEKKIPPLRKEDASKSAKVQSLNLALKQLDEDKKRLDSEKMQANERLNDLNKDIIRINDQITDATNSIRSLDSEHDELTNSLTPNSDSDLAISILTQRKTDAANALKDWENINIEKNNSFNEDQKIRDQFQERREITTKIKAEILAIQNIISDKEKKYEWRSILKDISVESGYELALGAAFEEDLSGSEDESAPIHWSNNPVLGQLNYLPEGVTCLNEFVSGPDKIRRSLSQVGIVSNRNEGAEKHKLLKPGQRLVTKDGDLWRWDGYVKRLEPEAESTASYTLQIKNRLLKLEDDFEKENNIEQKMGDLAKESKIRVMEITKKEEIFRKNLRDAEKLVDASQSQLAGKQQDLFTKTRLENINKDISLWKKRLQDAELQLDSLKKRKDKANEEVNLLSTRPAIIQKQSNEITNQLMTAEEEQKKSNDSLVKAETELNNSLRNLREADKVASSAREDLVRREASLDQTREKIKNISQITEEKIGCNINDLRNNTRLKPNEDLPSIEKAEKSLQRLNNERENIGAVNLRAEQESEDLDSQISQLNNEKDDLNNAIMRLREGIAKLNKEGRQRLLNSFNQVNSNFREIFVKLFGGGKAHIALIGSDDPLEAGLEIFASPPGKRMQNMSLLSGGEQALTALSLLFSVFLVNPAPICVLDEVDAPLDDANVDRFCKLIKEITNETGTKMIIVTHHRMTMSRVDRLFGVTMAEQGISKLVSVNLATADEIAETA